jgi:hypothetical protein
LPIKIGKPRARFSWDDRSTVSQQAAWLSVSATYYRVDWMIPTIKTTPNTDDHRDRSLAGRGPWQFLQQTDWQGGVVVVDE